jgi:hypothetical protein
MAAETPLSDETIDRPPQDMTFREAPKAEGRRPKKRELGL